LNDEKFAMTNIYGMRRANGDWFALDDDGQLRMPLYLSSDEAMQARALSPGMLLFKPVILEERALTEFKPTEGESSVRFWLADGPSTKLKHGYLIDHAQLVLLICNPTEQCRG
jgi:hypothetical protein